MTRRKLFSAVLAVECLAVSLASLYGASSAADVQQPAKTYGIGVLTAAGGSVETLLLALRGLGYVPYWADEIELSRRAASYVDRILKGARPEGIPIEQPTKYDLMINLKTAKALALTIPPSLLLRATVVE